MKRYLLDTHLIYWWMTADGQLGKSTARIIEKSEIYVSTVSLWEMVLKNAKGKLPLPDAALTDQLLAQGFVMLPILPRHIEAVRRLSCAHADPFDRMLVAQAGDEGMRLLTRDAVLLNLGLDAVAKG